jgi:hypothetical protein
MQRATTLTGVQGNSGKAAATARAPPMLVLSDNPTKNSFPRKYDYKIRRFQKMRCVYQYGSVPVNRTSPPSIVAVSSAISTIGRPSSFWRMAFMIMACEQEWKINWVRFGVDKSQVPPSAWLDVQVDK